MSRPTFLEIDLKALKHNLKKVKAYAPNSAILAMIKANAYGHGFEQVAKTLDEADAFGVACIEEALQLRAAGVRKRIILVEGFFKSEELAAIAAHDLDIVIHHPDQLHILEQQKLTKPIQVWLKIDTGMHRLGFMPAEVPSVWQRLLKCPVIKSTPKLMSHFSDSDNLSSFVTAQQLRCFNECTLGIKAERSLANSAAIIAWPQTHFDWIRPGIMLYGASPFADKTGADFDLQPVMTLHSELIAVHQLAKGAAVGYGGTGVCPENMPVGIVAIGYADGYPRHAKNGTPVLVNNKKVPLIGRVSMDMISVDLRTQPNAKVGDPVILWGRGLAVEQVAKEAETVGYELLSGIQQRVARI